MIDPVINNVSLVDTNDQQSNVVSSQLGDTEAVQVVDTESISITQDSTITEPTSTISTPPDLQQADDDFVTNTSAQFPTQCIGTGSRAYSGFMFMGSTCNPEWRVCSADDGYGSTDSWYTLETDFTIGNGSHAGRICIKRCPDDANYIADPSFPGLGWDNLNLNACAVAPESDRYDPVPVPLYLPDNAPDPEIFATPLAYYLYAEESIWNCAVQERQLSHDHFLNTGLYIDLLFKGTGELFHKLSANAEWNEGSWGFDAYTGHKVLSVEVSSDSYCKNTINGNFRVNTNTLEIYNTTVDRLTCTTDRAAEMTLEYPASMDEIQSAPLVSLEELRALTLECSAFQSTSIHPQSAYYGGGGHIIEDHSTIQQRTITNVRQVEVSDTLVHQERYALDNTDANYSYTGSFSERNQSVGDVSRSPGDHVITFKKIADAIFMTERNHSGGGSENSGTYTYTLSKCQTIQ